ncbi:septum formation initiator family protein [Evansella sp. LMS18]|jgi:cell division protein DivIC|uniref:FtsB family cell division protein n=1 Tax=Evansella sp. LMS18 TaxID=2924033 RepID=UPI0020D11E89|nr:septum formation initiator family protein [Evansella sp. LMS18]UTR12454.1 septum formation initiator family protein [Evansella sp. LMS18]
MMNGQKGKVRQLTSEYMEKQAILHEQKLRRRKGLIRRLTVFGFVCALIVVFTGVTLYNQHMVIQEQEAKQNELDKEMLTLEKEAKELTEEIELLQDPDYIAEIARRDFFLTKPGETLFQLPRRDTSSD